MAAQRAEPGILRGRAAEPGARRARTAAAPCAAGPGRMDRCVPAGAQPAPGRRGVALRRQPAYRPSQRRSTRLALVPPKPKLLESTVRSGASRVVVTSGRSPTAGSGVSTLTEPAMKPSCSM